jgi:hypothetical protein
MFVRRDRSQRVGEELATDAVLLPLRVDEELREIEPTQPVQSRSRQHAAWGSGRDGDTPQKTRTLLNERKIMANGRVRPRFVPGRLSEGALEQRYVGRHLRRMEIVNLDHDAITVAIESALEREEV